MALVSIWGQGAPQIGFDPGAGAFSARNVPDNNFIMADTWYLFCALLSFAELRSITQMENS